MSILRKSQNDRSLQNMLQKARGSLAAVWNRLNPLWGSSLTSLANVAFAADTNAVADAVLSEAISRTQNLMVSMSAGCSGGRSGVPPVNWGALQTRGNSAVNAFNAA